MQKINFQDLPSTSTPLNASTLNQMQDNIESAIEDVESVIPTIENSLDSDSTTNGTSVHATKLLNTYSTNELKIGTWIDGKPIYRKVIQFTTATTETDLTIDVSSLNIDRLVKLDGTNGTNTDTRPINFLIMFGTTPYYVSARYSGASGNNPDRVLVKCSTAYGGLLSYLILEYTKTTD